MYYPIKVNYKNVRAIINNTNYDFNPFKAGKQGVEMAMLGYYTPSDANWSYQVGIATHESTPGKIYVIVKRFGGVEGVLELPTGVNK